MIKKDIKLKSKNNINGIVDDQYYRIQNEFDQIRTSLGMYISKGNTEGALHIIKEIINNALDEYNNETARESGFWKGKQKRVQVEYYESENRVIISDNGRGIPTDMVVDVVMHKHTSTKTIGISQTRNKKQTGLNGTGMTATAALSDYMSVTTYRGETNKRIEIINSELKEHKIAKNKKYRTGMVVEFIPSSTYLGDYDLTTEIIEGYLRNLTYIMEPEIEIEFIGELTGSKGKDNKPKLFTRKFTTAGLKAACEYMSSSLEFAPIEAKYIAKDYDLSIAFAYDRTISDTSITSFCNYVITSEGGTHEIATVRAICDFFVKEAKRTDPNNKLEINYDDCKKGLVLAVNLEHVEPKFEGQHKTKVSNEDVRVDGKRNIQSSIYNVMMNNPVVTKKIIQYLRQVAKARQESHKIRGISAKKHTTFLEDSKISKYFTISNRNSSGYKELYLAEGDGAAGAILQARNPAFQAVYTVAGVTDNVYDLPLSKVLQKSTFAELFQILGAGVGKDFDINKLRYDKIILCADSDIDGRNINSLLLCFFLIFTPEIITSGKLYKAMPPLYLMDRNSLKRRSYNGREWLYDKKEYYNMLHTIIANNVEVALEVGKYNRRKEPEVRVLSRNDLIKWLDMNSEYVMELNNLGKKSGCAPTILEDVCILRNKVSNPFEFQREITKIYPEMTFNTDTNALIGSYDGEQFSLICDRIFDNDAKRFYTELLRNETIYVWYRNKQNPNDKATRVSIGTFLTEIYRIFNVKINNRFKGVGEAETELLFKTTTNPKFRKLIRIDISDIKETHRVFELLHGKSAKLREARRDMIDSFKLSYMDIDN